MSESRDPIMLMTRYILTSWSVKSWEDYKEHGYGLDQE